jgi:hypothetical protein
VATSTLVAAPWARVLYSWPSVSMAAARDAPVEVAREIGLDDSARVNSVHADPVACPAAGRLDREQNVGGLRLPVGRASGRRDER